MKLVVTGATGFVGKALIPLLRAQGDDVIVLSRDAARAKSVFSSWGDVTAVTADLEAHGRWTEALAGADAVIHLAGEPVAGKRWDARQKQVIRDSRVEATRVLVEAIGKLALSDRPRTLVSSSGTDYYPFAIDKAGFDDDEVTEADPPADTFLGRVCRDWEKEALNAASLYRTRVCIFRVGMVLGKGGGALAHLAGPFKAFFGGPIAGGRQWVPWIHRDDVAACYALAARDERYSGPINLITESVRQKQLAAAIGRALHRPSWLPAPKFGVRMVAGELAEYLFHGRNVVPKRLRELGYTWKHTDLDAAVAECFA